MVSRLVRGFTAWIDAVASTVAGMVARFRRPRLVTVTQIKGNEFELRQTGALRSSPAQRFVLDVAAPHGLPPDVVALIAGSRVELLLPPEIFMFRTIELPGRAADFLQGIVRAQIDRLTPWSANAAAFGWSKPVASAESISLTVAATARSMLVPYCDVFNKRGAHSVVIATAAPDDAKSPITILEDCALEWTGLGRIRTALATAMLGGAAAAAVTSILAIAVDMSLEARRSDVAQQLAVLRANVGTAQQLVERRKRQLPAVVLVLDALSDILPDHTYVTELHVEANKVRFVGVSRDAASLIHLIERSGRFTRAHFVAPTIRSEADTTERFHIEAIVQLATAERS